MAAGDNDRAAIAALRARSPQREPEGLLAAPLLDEWAIGGWFGGVLVASGYVSEGHARLRAGSKIATSEIRAIDGNPLAVQPRWLRTQNTLYALGAPAREHHPAVYVALAPTWRAALQVAVELTVPGTLDLQPREAVTSLEEHVAASDNWAKKSRLAAAVANSLRQAGRERLAEAWSLLAADPVSPKAAVPIAQMLSRISLGQHEQPENFARIATMWKIWASGDMSSLADRDFIAGAHAALEKVAPVMIDTFVLADEDPADAFVQTAAAKTWLDAWAIARHHIELVYFDAIIAGNVIDLPGEDRWRMLRDLRMKAEEADHGDSAELLRLLAINPADRRDVEWVVEQLADRKQHNVVQQRWRELMMRTIGEDTPSDPGDAFASAFNAHASFVAEVLSRQKVSPPTLPETAADEPAAADEQTVLPPGVVVVREIGGTSQTTSAKEVQREFKDIVGRRLPLALVPPLAPVRATLHDEFPHLAEQIDMLLMGLVEGYPLRLPPILFAGAPGAGKSRLARRLSETLGVSLHRYDGAGASDNAFAGTARRWSSGSHAAPLEAIRKNRIANPFMLVDEAEKGGIGRHNGSLMDALNTFLEPENARNFNDPFVESEVDLSHVNYLLTVNDDTRLPGPVRDRLTKIVLPQPSVEHLPQIARRLVVDLGRENPLGSQWVAPLDDGELAIAETLWRRGGSVRQLARVVRAIVNQRQRSPRH